MPKSSLSATASLVLSALLGACMHVPMSTIAKLWSFDMATADPAAIRTAVRVPDALRPRRGGVRLDVTLASTGTEQPIKRTFVLEEATEPAELAPLARYRRPGYRLAAYRLSHRDVAEVRRLQADSRQRAAASGTRGKGQIAVAADACRDGDLPSGALLSSTYLLVEPSQGYLTLIDDLDLRRELNPTALTTSLPPC